MIFNVNHLVRVRLTPRGRDICRQQAAELRRAHPTIRTPYTPPREDENGWSDWQLWHLMEVFGPYVGPGAEIPFETDIEIPASS